MIELIAIFAVLLMSMFFPACLVDAIREPDAEKADMCKMKAGLLFAGIVLLSLLILN